MNYMVQQITHLDLSHFMNQLEQIPGLRNFVEHNMYLAGGAVRDLLRKKVPNDYDLFFRTGEAKDEFVRRFSRAMTGTPFKNFEITLNGTFKIGPSKVQFITMFTGSPEKVVGGFDWSVNMVWADLSQTSLTKAEAPFHYPNPYDNCLYFNLDATHAFSAIERLPRFLAMGYTISAVELQKALVALTLGGAITDPKQVPVTFSSSSMTIQYAVQEVMNHKTKNSKLYKTLHGEPINEDLL
jgi:hypothetical protein